MLFFFILGMTLMFLFFFILRNSSWTQTSNWYSEVVSISWSGSGSLHFFCFRNVTNMIPSLFFLGKLLDSNFGLVFWNCKRKLKWEWVIAFVCFGNVTNMIPFLFFLEMASGLELQTGILKLRMTWTKRKNVKIIY